MNTLDQWEEEAREGKQWNQDLEFRERILALIELVRKKDTELKNAKALIHTEICQKDPKCHVVCDRLDNALALTAELSDGTEQLK